MPLARSPPAVRLRWLPVPNAAIDVTDPPLGAGS